MSNPQVLGLIAFAYLLGSIPFGYLICRLFFGIDVRTQGSGNIGATNVMRVAGKIPALFVLLLDAGKGYLPVFLALHFGLGWAVACAVAAILGHSRSIFLGFKGGKSVATGAGTILAFNPIAGLGAFMIWLIILAITRYVSLASIVAALSLPLLMWLLHSHWLVVFYGGVAGLYVVIRHRANITRLKNGTEPKIGSVRVQA